MFFVTSYSISVKRLVTFIVATMALMMVLVSFLVSNTYFHSQKVHRGMELVTSEMLLSMMGTENPYFTTALPEGYEPPSMATISFEMATSIEMGDIRSLLGRELPGLALFDTRIIVAGEGTNLSNMPFESPPPMEVLLEEREAVMESSDEEEADTESTPDTERQTDSTRVFIHHTHSWESFLPHLPGVENPNQATHNEMNIIKVGERLGDALEKHGIQAAVDKTDMTALLHERNVRPSRAYEVSREIVQEAIEEQDDLSFIFDLHRDSVRRDGTTVTINGKEYAQVLFVIGESHPDYEKNLELATKLHEKVEEKYPGLSRGVFGRDRSSGNGVYNQDLSDQSILIEFGGVDNHIDELNRSADAFAEVFADYFWTLEDG
ncbi:stage II sporulation protein P [Halalkalibacterium halodurans]|uniref:stage II sporulation protein P n=1 Tax=Halalkalibacterium halodurans TaxID=86665 RepID=UPI002E1F3557|nr:stage II sporulation protein P [Halalkalibacterium halodurans]